MHETLWVVYEYGYGSWCGHTKYEYVVVWVYKGGYGCVADSDNLCLLTERTAVLWLLRSRLRSRYDQEGGYIYITNQ